MKPVDAITNEIRRRLKGMSGTAIDLVCDLMEQKYSQGDFKRATDLIDDGIKLAKKMETVKK